MVEKALEQFRGKIMQLPPLYSALKMNGKPLYEYAREGRQIPREIEKRPVEVQELELLEWMEGGTHDHKLPTEEAGKAEVAVAEKLWRIEKEQEAKEQEEQEKKKNEAQEKFPEGANEAFWESIFGGIKKMRERYVEKGAMHSKSSFRFFLSFC